MSRLSVLIPTFNRPTALTITLAGLTGQTLTDFRVIIAEQNDASLMSHPSTQTVIHLLQSQNRPVDIHPHLPRKGMAEVRQFLLDQVDTPYCLFLDDDLILEPFVLHHLLETVVAENCGLVGAAPIGLSYLDDIRPHEQQIEWWDNEVVPETISPDSPAWDRHKLHNAANLYHVAQSFGLNPRYYRRYKIAWVGSCVLYDTEKLRSTGGFEFWRDLPVEHAGEDVVAELRVMAKYGGCALIPSGVYHQELPTTLPNREVSAPDYLA